MDRKEENTILNIFNSIDLNPNKIIQRIPVKKSTPKPRRFGFTEDDAAGKGTVPVEPVAAAEPKDEVPGTEVKPQPKISFSSEFIQSTPIEGEYRSEDINILTTPSVTANHTGIL
jgi:hypothetical protein